MKQTAAASYLTSLRLCVFSSVLEINLVTYAIVRGPMAGSSFSQPSKQLMEDVKQSSSMLSGRRPSMSVAKAAISAGSGLDAIATIYADNAPCAVERWCWSITVP
jgi:hypothetical protein